MRLTLTDDDGVVLDEATVTSDEWLKATKSPEWAWSILSQLHPGDVALKITDAPRGA